MCESAVLIGHEFWRIVHAIELLNWCATAVGCRLNQIIMSVGDINLWQQGESLEHSGSQNVSK